MLTETPIVQDLLASLKEMIEAYGSDDGHGPVPIIERAKAAVARVELPGTEYNRLTKWRASLHHWLAVGYTYETARALASVLHGRDNDVKEWAKGVMESKTNLRLEDML
jgi:hypothetical protein